MQKILRKEKRESWRAHCSSFNLKTPTAELWRLIKLFKGREWTSDIMDSEKEQSMINKALNKLCPSSCVNPPAAFLGGYAGGGL